MIFNIDIILKYMMLFDPTTPYQNVDIYRATPAVVTPEPGYIEPGVEDHIYEMIWFDDVTEGDQLTLTAPVEVHQSEEERITDEEFTTMLALLPGPFPYTEETEIL